MLFISHLPPLPSSFSQALKPTKDYAGLYFVASRASGSVLFLRGEKKQKNIMAAQDLWTEHNVALLTT